MFTILFSCWACLCLSVNVTDHFSTRSSWIGFVVRRIFGASLPQIESRIMFQYLNHQSKIQRIVNTSCFARYCNLSNLNIESLNGITLPPIKFQSFVWENGEFHLQELNKLLLKNNHIWNLHGLRSKSRITHIDLTGNRFNEIKQLHANISHVTHLILDGNQITDHTLRTSFNFTSTPYLQVLSLRNNNITTLHGIAFPVLKTLDLSDNPMHDLSGFSANVEECILSNNGITNHMLKQLTNSDINITNTMNLTHNNITDLFGVRFPIELKRLVLDLNQIRRIGHYVFPSDLKYLHLSGVGVTDHNLRQIKFPESLIELDLSDNYITSISHIVFPPTLRILYLNNNKIKCLNRIHLPHTLTHLYLNDNQLENNRKHQMSIRFPESLHTLDLGNNFLHSLYGMKLPKHLKRLYLDNNGITHHMLFKMQFSLPRNMDFLNIRSNEITSTFGINFGGGVHVVKWRNNLHQSRLHTRKPNVSSTTRHVFVSRQSLYGRSFWPMAKAFSY
eukprot:501491_1